MTTSLAIGTTGLAAWRIIKASEARHIDNIAKDPAVRRASDYFRKGIASATSAEALVNDYRLLHIALRAFGLEQDIANKAFIQRVLASDLDDDQSLANRLSDKRYLRLAEALGSKKLEADKNEIGADISYAYVQREFERRIGENDENLRLALNARREMQQFSVRDSSDRTFWYEILGNPPLRKVFEGAFGFRQSYSQLSIDRQVAEFEKAAERVFGNTSFAALTTDDGTERLLSSFLARSQLQSSGPQNRYLSALALLSAS